MLDGTPGLFLSATFPEAKPQHPPGFRALPGSDPPPRAVVCVPCFVLKSPRVSVGGRLLPRSCFCGRASRQRCGPVCGGWPGSPGRLLILMVCAHLVPAPGLARSRRSVTCAVVPSTLASESSARSPPCRVAPHPVELSALC